MRLPWEDHIIRIWLYSPFLIFIKSVDLYYKHMQHKSVKKDTSIRSLKMIMDRLKVGTSDHKNPNVN